MLLVNPVTLSSNCLLIFTPLETAAASPWVTSPVWARDTVAAPVEPLSKAIDFTLYPFVSVPIAVIISPAENFYPAVTSIELSAIAEVPLVVVILV